MTVHNDEVIVNSLYANFSKFVAIIFPVNSAIHIDVNFVSFPCLDICVWHIFSTCWYKFFFYIYSLLVRARYWELIFSLTRMLCIYVCYVSSCWHYVHRASICDIYVYKVTNNVVTCSLLSHCCHCLREQGHAIDICVYILCFVTCRPWHT